MTILRIQKKDRSRFLIVDQSVLELEDLSWEAKGLWAYLMSKSEEWRIEVKNLSKQFPAGKNKIYKCLRQLMDFGVCESFQPRKTLSNGKIVADKIQYIIYEVPQEKEMRRSKNPKSDDENSKKEYQLPQNQKTDNQLTDNGDTYLPKIEYIPKKKSKKEKRSDPSPKITFNKITRKFEGITIEDFKGWAKTFPSVNVRKVLDECELWALSNEREHYRISITTYLRNTAKNHTTPFKEEEKENIQVPEDEVNENKTMADKWEKNFEGKGNGIYAIQATTNKIIFVMPNNQGYEVNYYMKKEEFEKKCLPVLKKMKIF
jgi:hypothetical protein